MGNEGPSDDKTENETRDQEERDDTDRKPASAPTRAGSNVPNAGRDPDEDRTE
jgi:hypothetical protein